MKLNVSLILTPRDEGLLLDCYRNGLLSFAQIKARHFPGITDSTICNRLSRLHRAKLISKQYIGVQVFQGSPKRIGTVYQISRKGIAMLQSRYIEESFREDPVPLNTASLSHDLALTDAITALEKRFPGQNIIHGKLLQGGTVPASRVPDAIIEGVSSGKKWAIELELTAKSNRRYREIITSYRLMPDYERVLYIISACPTRNKIQAQILGYKVPDGTQGLSTGKFYFGLLSELTRSPNQARLSNGTENLISRIEADSDSNRKTNRS